MSSTRGLWVLFFLEKTFVTFLSYLRKGYIVMDRQNHVIFIVWSLQIQWKRRFTIDKFQNKAFQVSDIYSITLFILFGVKPITEKTQYKGIGKFI